MERLSRRKQGDKFPTPYIRKLPLANVPKLTRTGCPPPRTRDNVGLQVRHSHARSREVGADRRVNRAYDEYKDERAAIEAQYNEAKEQVVQRLLASMEERRRKLREEKEGGEIISGQSPVYPHSII